MNTADLREYVYKESMNLFEVPLTKDEATLLVDTVIAGIVKGLTTTEEKKVLLRGFGKFEVVTRKGRTYIVRGQEVEIPDRLTVVFKPGSDLKREIGADE